MRQSHPHLSLGRLCGLFGKTRNACYDHQRRATAQVLLDRLVRALVGELRRELRRLGTRKLPFLLLSQLGEYAPRVGRDYLFACWPATACLSVAASGAWSPPRPACPCFDDPI